MALVIVHGWLALASMFAGYLALRARKFSAIHPRLGEFYHWFFLLMSLTALALSYTRGRATVFTYLTPPSYALALLGYLMAKFRPVNWLQWHIAGQAGSYIALIIGIGFQIVPRFWRSDSSFWAILLTPIAVGTYFIARTERKWAKVTA